MVGRGVLICVFLEVGGGKRERFGGERDVRVGCWDPSCLGWFVHAERLPDEQSAADPETERDHLSWRDQRGEGVMIW